mgnify:FL=1
MDLLDGRKISNDIKIEIAQSVSKIRESGMRPPHLAAVIVGNDGASMTYVGAKVKACDFVGFQSTLVKLPESTPEISLIKKIHALNEDSKIDGFIVQLPLPNHMDEQKILMAISPDKDVDGFHPTNVGKLSLGLPTFISATPYGIIELLKRYNVKTSGKHVVVIGRSNIVGRPLSILMSQKRISGNATVTVAHSRTQNLSDLTKKADIIVTALGIPEFLKADMIKSDSVIIDVGITRVNDSSTKKGYKIVGDVDFENVSKRTSYITPVPGGVGPMTIAMLLKNTLQAYNKKHA